MPYNHQKMNDFFTQTSNDPYLKHNYKLVFKNKKCQIFDNYQDTVREWYNNKEQCNFIEVLD